MNAPETRLPPLASGQTHHLLASSPATCHWGFFDAKLPSVLRVRSGDRVTIECLSGKS